MRHGSALEAPAWLPPDAGHRNARRAAARLLEAPPLGYCQTPSDTTPFLLRPPQKNNNFTPAHLDT